MLEMRSDLIWWSERFHGFADFESRPLSWFLFSRRLHLRMMISYQRFLHHQLILKMKLPSKIRSRCFLRLKFLISSIASGRMQMLSLLRQREAQWARWLKYLIGCMVFSLCLDGTRQWQFYSILFTLPCFSWGLLLRKFHLNDNPKHLICQQICCHSAELNRPNITGVADGRRRSKIRWSSFFMKLSLNFHRFRDKPQTSSVKHSLNRSRKRQWWLLEMPRESSKRKMKTDTSFAGWINDSWNRSGTLYCYPSSLDTYHI